RLRPMDRASGASGRAVNPSTGLPCQAAPYRIVYPSGAKRAERMQPRRKVSCRYIGGGNGAVENSSLPAYTPAPSNKAPQSPRSSAIGTFLRRVTAVGIGTLTVAAG